jgi:hypothetical protein
MRWEDEQFVKVYTRNTATWLALSFDAQSLLLHLLRIVDRAGILTLGKHGRRAVAILLGAQQHWEIRLAPALAELEADGCVQVSGDTLVIPKFREAQEARQSERARKTAQRERDRAAAVAGGFGGSVTGADIVAQMSRAESHVVTPPVTRGHTESPLEETRLDEKRIDESNTSLSADADPGDGTEELNPSGGDSGPRPEELQALWNSLAAPGLPRWEKMTPKRRAAARARLREHGLEDYRRVIEFINRDPFHTGQNGRGWLADPEYLLRPDTAVKLLERAAVPAQGRLLPVAAPSIRDGGWEPVSPKGASRAG